MHLHPPDDPGVGVVVETRRCTAARKASSFVRHVCIDVSKTRLAGAFRPGQAFGVLPPGTDEHGRAHKLRLYSIASPTCGEEGAGGVISTTVKRLIDEHHETHRLHLGVASNYLCDLRPGDEVKVTGPSGKRFVLPKDPDAHDYVFFATGTGIAPFRGMLLDLFRRAMPYKGSAVLMMGSPYATDLLYHDELLALSAEHRNLTYLTAISRERQADGGGPMYVHDRLVTHRDQLAALLARERTLVYMCGITGLEIGVFQRLAGALAPAELEQYLAVDPKVREAPASWTRRMIHKQIRPTRRVFVEVYD